MLLNVDFLYVLIWFSNSNADDTDDTDNRG